MEWWMWLIFALYLLAGFVKTVGRMSAGKSGTSVFGTLIVGTLLWPFL